MDLIISGHIAGSYFEFGTHRARTFTMVMGLDDFYSSNMGATAGGLTPKTGGGYLDKYYVLTRFKVGLPIRILLICLNTNLVAQKLILTNFQIS